MWLLSLFRVEKTYLSTDSLKSHVNGQVCRELSYLVYRIGYVGTLSISCGGWRLVDISKYMGRCAQTPSMWCIGYGISRLYLSRVKGKGM